MGYAHALDRDQDGFLSEAEVNAAPQALNMWLGLWAGSGLLNAENAHYRLTPALDPQGQRKVRISEGFTTFFATSILARDEHGTVVLGDRDVYNGPVLRKRRQPRF